MFEWDVDEIAGALKWETGLNDNHDVRNSITQETDAFSSVFEHNNKDDTSLRKSDKFSFRTNHLSAIKSQQHEANNIDAFNGSVLDTWLNSISPSFGQNTAEETRAFDLTDFPSFIIEQGDYKFLESHCGLEDGDNFIDYQWANVDNLSDFNGLLRNNDSLLDIGLIDNAPKLWASTVAPEPDTINGVVTEQVSLPASAAQSDIYASILDECKEKYDQDELNSSSSKYENSFGLRYSHDNATSGRANFAYHTIGARQPAEQKDFVDLHTIIPPLQSSQTSSPEDLLSSTLPAYTSRGNDNRAVIHSSQLHASPEGQQMQRHLFNYQQESTGRSDGSVDNRRNPNRNDICTDCAAKNTSGKEPSLSIETNNQEKVYTSFDVFLLAEFIFEELQQAILKLDIRTRMCIRDSLFRLARSAKQRHHIGGAINQRNAKNDDIVDETSKNDSSTDAETGTNPFDRTVAYLLLNPPPKSVGVVMDGPFEVTLSGAPAVISLQTGIGKSTKNHAPDSWKSTEGKKSLSVWTSQSVLDSSPLT